MSDDKILSTLKKLQALAERGIGGERTNAQRFLEKFMNEHNITESMLENPDRTPHNFYIAKSKKDLFFQCVYSVLNPDGTFTYKESRGGSRKYEDCNRKHYYVIDCTDAEYIEIEYIFKWYSFVPFYPKMNCILIRVGQGIGRI